MSAIKRDTIYNQVTIIIAFYDNNGECYDCDVETNKNLFEIKITDKTVR